MSDAFQALQKTITEAGQLQARLLVENQRLQDENKRLRDEIFQNKIDLEEYRRDVEALEQELKDIGAMSWRTPDEKAVDADLQREDAHERKRLEREYPWKE